MLEKLASIALVVLSSCFVNSFEYSPIRSNDAVVWIRWTVDGRADERSCPSLNAVSAHVAIQRSDGKLVASKTRACDDFVSRHELEAGNYRVSVTLLDQEDKVVAGPESVSFVVEGDDSEEVDVPFNTPDLS